MKSGKMIIVGNIFRYVFWQLRRMKLLILIFFSLNASAQLFEEAELLAQLNFSATIPTDLIATRSVVLYQNTFTKSEFVETQKFFQQTGIDPVCYFDIAYVVGGHDTKRAFSRYFSGRGIKYLIFLQKVNNQYQFIFASYIGNKELVDKTSIAWKQSNTSLQELLRTIYRFAVSNLKRQNYLINDLPETDIAINYFSGRHNETFSFEAKSFKTAVPKWGIEKDDAELEAFFKENYPLKYELVDQNADENDLLLKGFRTILRVVHTRGSIAREILGYDMTLQASSLPTTVYVNGEPQIKTILAEQPVYKFYFKNIEYGNLFLGTHWDADITWQDALRNNILGFKADAKIN